MGHRLSRDIGLQFLSVLLALALWIQATAVQNPVDRFTFESIPVVVEGIPEDMVVAEALRPAKISVTVKCRRRVAGRLTADSFVAKLSLAEGQMGSADYSVEIDTPGNVDVVEVSPATVTVVLEHAASATVPIEVRLDGTAPDGYAAGSPLVAPAETVIRGPLSAVNRVSRAVAGVDLSSATTDISRKIVLVPLTDGGAPVSGLKLEPAEVLVTVPIVALPPAQSVDVDASLTGSPGEGFAVLGIYCSPSRVAVRPTVGGSINFDRLLTAPIDISGATADVETTVSLVLPAGVATVDPATVQVVVEIGATRTFAGVSILVRNPAPGLKATTSPAAVDVVLRGPRVQLDRLVLGDVVVWVDAGGHGLGQTQVPVNVTLPDWAGDLAVAATTPAEVTLAIER